MGSGQARLRIVGLALVLALALVAGALVGTAVRGMSGGPARATATPPVVGLAEPHALADPDQLPGGQPIADRPAPRRPPAPPRPSPPARSTSTWHPMERSSSRVS